MRLGYNRKAPTCAFASEKGWHAPEQTPCKDALPTCVVEMKLEIIKLYM
jgi:hypothetical protein